MTPMDHYREAERLIGQAEKTLDDPLFKNASTVAAAAAVQTVYALAQVHATLATVDKTSYLADGRGR